MYRRYLIRLRTVTDAITSVPWWGWVPHKKSRRASGRPRCYGKRKESNRLSNRNLFSDENFGTKQRSTNEANHTRTSKDVCGVGPMTWYGPTQHNITQRIATQQYEGLFPPECWILFSCYCYYFMFHLIPYYRTSNVVPPWIIYRINYQ